MRSIQRQYLAKISLINEEVGRDIKKKSHEIVLNQAKKILKNILGELRNEYFNNENIHVSNAFNSLNDSNEVTEINESDVVIEINELEERLRDNNIFNIGDVEYAILETSGQVTVIPKPNKRPATPQDFNIEPKYEGIPYDLVIDGKVEYGNLKKIGKNYAWLEKQTEKFGIKPEEALIITIDGDDQFFCQALDKEEK